MSNFKNVYEAWDVTNGYTAQGFNDNRLRWFDSDTNIRMTRNFCARLLLSPTLEDATSKVDAMFDRFGENDPTQSKVLRAVASTLSQSNEQNWKLNLRLLYRKILK